MTGGGVETAIKGDEFAGMLHTDEHFATGFVVVAGGGQNVFDGTGIGTFMQKSQDSPAVWGTDGTGTQTLEHGGIGHRKPGEQRLVMLGGDLVGERGRCGTQGVFGRQQEAVTFVARVGCEQEVAASGAERG